MSYLISYSYSYFIQAATLRLGFGLVLAGLIAATQAAQPDEDFFVPKLNLLTTQFVHSSTGFLPPYQFSASVVLTGTPDTASTGLGFINTFQLPSVAKPQTEAVRAINANWQQTYGGDRVSLQHLLRVEFNGEQGDIVFQPHSISIEEKRLKVMLKLHSLSMLWKKSF